MTVLGTALRPAATKVMLLGSGELGKEVAIECQRLGIETIAVDRYPDAPAMQVAHRAHVINMLHGESLRALIEQEKPDYIVPEIEAIATDTLVELEQAGQKVVPTARAAKLTMNREGIRRLAAEELQLPTSRYRFADSEEGFRAAVTEIGLPCIVKPVMSSSGKGQSFIRSADQLSEAWRYAQQGGRAGAGRVIVEGVVNFISKSPAHRQRCRWRAFLRSGWPSSGRRRLPRVLAAAADERPGPRACPGHRPRGGAGAGRLWSVWRGAVRMRRRGDLQRSLPATTRHRDGDAYLPGSLGIRPARSRLPRATRRRYPPVWSGRLRGDPSAVVQPERQLWPAAVGRRGWPAAASVRQAGD